VFIEKDIDNSTLLWAKNVYATQNGEILDEVFNKNMQGFMNAMYDEKEETNQKVRQQMKGLNKTESFGDFATALFYEYNSESPIHVRESIRNASLDWLERNVNIEDSADTWFVTTNSDEGDQFEYLEGQYETPWKPPANYLSLVKVILGQKHDDPVVIPPNWIRFNREVTEIKYSDTDDAQVNVTCRNGEIYRADHVISTVSLGVMKYNHYNLFNPNLSALKQLAIRHIGYGTVDKISLEFANPWWEASNDNFTGLSPLWEYNETGMGTAEWFASLKVSQLMEIDADNIPTWAKAIESFKVVDSGSHPNVLQGWISGPMARFMETLDTEYVANSCLLVLRNFIGSRYPDIPNTIRSAKSSWFMNQFTRGSYSFRTVDAEDYDVWARDLAAPILNNEGRPVLQFAGEATNNNHFSTVHGAYDTGKREAQRLIDYYGTFRN
jgi:hypothetical protein